MAEHVLVVGAGTMGAGIAQVCAQSGRRVTLVDVDRARLEVAREGMARSLEKLAAKGLVEGAPEAVLARVAVHAGEVRDLPAEGAADIGVEAVFEDLALKRRLLPAMERACREGALLATNTSGIPVTALAEALRAPGRFVGLHFFNPVVLMRTVEVIRGDRTTDEAFERAATLARSLGKDPLLVQRDVPGFVLNRIGSASSNEALRLVQDGIATAEDIDRGVKGAFGYRMGPFETMDLVGLDVVLDARTLIFEQTGDPRFEPPELLRRMVREGRLGRKTGRGFYDHGED